MKASPDALETRSDSTCFRSDIRHITPKILPKIL